MPSPLGHALGGAAVGLLVARPGSVPVWTAAALAITACLPDLDLFTSQHSGITHSIGFATLAGLVFYIATRDGRFAAAAALAYASHILFDWLGRDTWPPLGVMALWPFSTGFYMSPVSLLEPVSRRYWLPGFWSHTLKVALIELVVFGGSAALVWRLRVSRWRRA